VSTGEVWGYNPVKDDWSGCSQSRPLSGDISRNPVLLREALIAHDVYSA